MRGAEGIQTDLDSLPSSYKERVSRVFLADGNALAMETSELLKTLEVLYNQLPSLA